MALLFLLTIGGTLCLVDLMARSHRVDAWLTAWDLERARTGREHFVDRGSFLEFEDWLLLEEIPQADYRHGGIFFFGTSSLKWALNRSELPDSLSAPFRNYGIGATNHQMQLQFLRYLVDYRGFLAEDAGKTRIVLGAAWSMGCDIPPSSYFGPLWERYGLYDYDPIRGIQPATMSRPGRLMCLERARCSSCVGGNVRRARKVLMGMLRPDAARERLIDPGIIAQRADLLTGNSDWQKPLEQELAAFGQFIELVQARGGQVVVVLLPVRTILRARPLPVAYAAGVRTTCAKYVVPVVDLAGLLDDSEFWDMNHCDYAGLVKVHAALVDAAQMAVPGARADPKWAAVRE